MRKTSPASAIPPAPRRRAPSRRAIATSLSILDAAEELFAERGYDGASVRDIASAAGAQIASISFHHGGKAALFEKVVERRAEELSKLRLDHLARLHQADGQQTLNDVLSAFLRPYLEKIAQGDPHWIAYARLVAMVSADARWRQIAERCFDPTANIFIDEIAALFPGVEKSAVAMAFVFSVSAMLSLSTSQWRIAALSGEAPAAATMEALSDALVRYCEAGLRAALER